MLTSRESRTLCLLTAIKSDPAHTRDCVAFILEDALCGLKENAAGDCDLYYSIQSLRVDVCALPDNQALQRDDIRHRISTVCERWKEMLHERQLSPAVSSTDPQFVAMHPHSPLP